MLHNTSMKGVVTSVEPGTPTVLRSTSTSSPVRPAATFPPATHCPLGGTLEGVYPTLMEPVLLPKETSRVTRPERPRVDAGHAFLTKPPAREPASSPSKSSEPRSLAPPAPATQPSPAPQQRALYPTMPVRTCRRPPRPQICTEKRLKVNPFPSRNWNSVLWVTTVELATALMG